MFRITLNNKDKQQTTVGIVGGGIAGLAAGCALVDSGFRVTVFERRPFVGGRASSYEHPGTGETVDNCQHVLLGCCTNLLDFYGRIRVSDKIQWFDRLTFIQPGGRRSEISPSGLPAPFHASLSFLRASSLSWPDK
ncbi:MAG: carotene 7,8-desaturase, partial [Acidobacteria bacterium]